VPRTGSRKRRREIYVAESTEREEKREDLSEQDFFEPQTLMQTSIMSQQFDKSDALVAKCRALKEQLKRRGAAASVSEVQEVLLLLTGTSPSVRREGLTALELWVADEALVQAVVETAGDFISPSVAGCLLQGSLVPRAKALTQAASRTFFKTLEGLLRRTPDATIRALAQLLQLDSRSELRPGGHQFELVQRAGKQLLSREQAGTLIEFLFDVKLPENEESYSLEFVLDIQGVKLINTFLLLVINNLNLVCLTYEPAILTNICLVLITECCSLERHHRTSGLSALNAGRGGTNAWAGCSGAAAEHASAAVQCGRARRWMCH
jgi:hypothetical protein